jgi:hypothetical protein
MKLLVIIFLLYSATLFSQDTLIIGTWVKKDYHSETWVLKKKKQLKKNHFNIQFNSDYGLVFRRNQLPFCGMHPISYLDRKGHWTKENEIVKLFYIKNSYPVILEFEILNQTSNKLTIKLIGKDEHQQISFQRAQKGPKL